MSDEAPPAEAPPEAEPAPEPRGAPPKRSRLVRVAFLGVAVVAALVILPRVPRDRQIDFQIENASTIVAVDLAWTRENGEAIQGGSWRFQPGQAPRSLSTNVHLPNGRYVVDVTLERTSGRDDLHRVIELDNTDHVTIPLR